MTKLCKPRKVLIALLLMLSACGLFLLWLLLPICNNADLTDPRYYIAHAAGAINGHTYTNSREALQHALKQQLTYIELDLQLTTDSVVVCSHDKVDNVSADSFLNSKIQGQFTPLTLEDALKIRKQHPFTLVTDKIDDPTILNQFFAHDKSQLIIEAFSWQRYIQLQREGYKSLFAFYEKSILHYIYYCLRCKERIEWITTSANSHADILKLRILKKLFGVKIAFVPLKNPMEQAKHYIGNEFDLIYVDDLFLLGDTIAFME